MPLYERRASLHERRIEVNHIDERGIDFMCWDDVGYNVVHATFSAKDARELAQELLEAADELDEILSNKGT